jgi:hypothetical protein
LVLTFANRVRLLLIAALAAAVWLYFHEPIAQSQAYHNFADQRTILLVPHFLNVLSNLPFALVGVAGLWFLFSERARRPGGPVDEPTVWLAYLVLFVGVGFTAFGSTYYHLDPNDRRLFWDRLPMAIAFMGLFGAVVAERIDLRAGKVLLMPLVVAGIWATLYWRETNDLRPYYYIQFFPLAALPFILWLFPPMYTRTADLVIALGWYVVAKFCETPLDEPILRAGHIVSGHTLKHLAAAMGTYQVLRMLQRRQRIVRSGPVHRAAAVDPINRVTTNHSAGTKNSSPSQAT